MNNTITSLLQNWKTTSAGVLAIVGSIVLIAHDPTQIIGATTGILSGIGLLAAADGKAPLPPAA